MASVPQAATIRDVDGDSHFLRGMDSQSNPLLLTNGFYRASMNTVNRGGILQTRPGYDLKFPTPDGLLQGGCLFRPTYGLEQLVVAVSGKIYASAYPFVDFALLENLNFRADAPAIYFCTGEKASQVQPDGTVKLISPYRILIVQDGFTAPGKWDGTTNVHDTDPKGIPLGTAMYWSGGRLWVMRRAEIFASDIDDPTSFIENTYMADSGSFLLEKPGVGFAEVATNGVNDRMLLAYTDSSTSVFMSGVRTRTDWATTPNFQAILFPNIGCVAHRSIVSLYGLTWWYSQFGLVNLNSAMSVYSSSEMQYKDNEMAISKGYLAAGQYGIACAAFENYILTSVPYADIRNTHTWVLDGSPSETNAVAAPAAWNSYWTGTRPVEWATGLVQGVNRIFQFSVDYDGRNRCWEAFSPERKDNGCPIICTVETRGYTRGSLQKKEIRYAELDFAELQDNVDVGVWWAGSNRGAFKRFSTKEIVATEGVISDGRAIEDTSPFFSFKKQSRLLRTQDVLESPPARTACDVESELAERTDSGFQMLVIWSGPAALKSTRLFFDWKPENKSGKCEPDESGEKFVRYDGSGANDETGLAYVPEIYYGHQTYSLLVNGVTTVVGTGDAESRISQHDADKMALAKAVNAANIYWGAVVTPVIGDFDNPLSWPPPPP